MQPLEATATAPTTTLGTVVTVNPYTYLATLTRHETYVLLAVAALCGVVGALLIQREAAAHLFRRRPTAH